MIVLFVLALQTEYDAITVDYSTYFDLHNSKLIDHAYANHVTESRQRSIECLAVNMYFESRGESAMGRQAVGFVTINRTKSTRFPNTICEVVYQSYRDKQGNPIRNKCQFSWYCDGKKSVIRDTQTYNKILREAQYLYELYYEIPVIMDITEGSTHFHADYVSPTWNQVYTQTTKIGTHIFYSNGG